MKKRSFLWGCLAAGAFLLLLAGIGGVWWYLRSRPQTAETPPASPVLVFLLSPSSGDEINAGHVVAVTLQATASTAIQSAELFVDGHSQGVVAETPQNASWNWQAWPPGIHTLSARAVTVDGKVGQSQTVMVTVLEGDFPTQAQEGQTLEQIGADFGVPPDQMASANGGMDPTLPLPGDFPVQVPTEGGENGDESTFDGGALDSGLISNLVHWHFKPTEAVDKSYCYLSFDKQVWYKLPKLPYHFFEGDGANYPQYDFPLTGGEKAIWAECWGWLGGTLKYLGEGETQFDPAQPPNEMVLASAGFVLTGVPHLQPMGGGEPDSHLVVPPPSALRKPLDEQECYQNHGFLAPFYCALRNDPNYVALVWEWGTGFCWPGSDCITDIDGYRFYEINQVSGTVELLQELEGDWQKVFAAPNPWPGICYGVRAFVNNPFIGESEMVTWCPGNSAPQPQTVVLSPTQWLTSGGVWIENGCGTYGNLDKYVDVNQKTGFGNQAGQVLIGSLVVDDEEDDCFRQGDYSGAVRFTLPSSLQFGQSAVLQKATLVIDSEFTDYHRSGEAANAPPYTCVKAVGEANEDWTGLGNAQHFAPGQALMGYADGPFADYGSGYIDVTSIVYKWMYYPINNHGFVLYHVHVGPPYTDGDSHCYTGAQVRLIIDYFTP